MGWLQEKIDKGDIPPMPLIKNFFKTLGPLSYAVARNPKVMFNNLKAWKKRIAVSKPPWAHLEDESMYDSTKMLREEDFRDLPPVSDEKYLRPTRLCDCHAKEIRAMAKKLGAYEKEPLEYAKSIFYFVKNQKFLVFKPMGGAIGVLKSKGGVCLDQMSLLIALARAGGIKARYRLYAFEPADEMADVMLRNDPVLYETYQMLGFLDSLHGCAELYIDGEWIQLDPTFSDVLEAGMGLPIAEFGEEPAWRVRIPERDIIFEGFPATFKEILSALAFALRHTVDAVNAKLDEVRNKGEQILREMGKEEYNRRKKKQKKVELPSIEEVRAFRQGILINETV
ncbi:MAG: transglutaminase family protein [Thermoplasmata archaeon]|nr:transglutaminase family protein [Thermoplasmata archaeon]